MRFLIGIIATVVALVALGFGVVRSGIYNIAATDPHNDVVAWAFDTTMHNSVRRRAEDVLTPSSFTEEQARNGITSFEAMCVLCHGAPGVERTEWAKGMKPTPPALSEAVKHWNSAELFRIVRHGIKMTGMPAMGPTHSDEEIWNIVAFVQQLPDITPEEYARFREELGTAGADDHAGAENGGGHGHQENGAEPSNHSGNEEQHSAGGHENAGRAEDNGDLQER